MVVDNNQCNLLGHCRASLAAVGVENVEGAGAGAALFSCWRQAWLSQLVPGRTSLFLGAIFHFWSLAFASSQFAPFFPVSRIRTGSLFYMPQSRECDLHQNPPTGLRYFNNPDLKAGAGCTRKCEPSSSLVHLVHIQMVRSELTRRIAQERANTILIFYDAI